VMEKARDLIKGCPVDKHTVSFVGERGTGKSWLLAHLRHELEKVGKLLLFSLNLADYVESAPDIAMMNVLRSFNREVLGREELPGATPADMSRMLMEKVRPLLERRPLALLVDSVYESDWRLLAALEDYLLGPLAIVPGMLIVMAGRGRPYPWRTPELRLEAEFVDLHPFSDVALTEAQLARQQKKAVPKAAEIHRLSGGNPLANYLLAAYDDPVVALNQVVEGMLETVPAERRRLVRDYLEALCVLRSFDEERIPMMLAAYYDDASYRRWSYAQARLVREEVVKWAFAHWDEEQGGYVLDGPTRRLLERYLTTAEPDRWKRLQRAAFELYERWAQAYPRTRARWQREVKYHVCQLQTAGAGQLSVAVSF